MLRTSRTINVNYISLTKKEKPFRTIQYFQNGRKKTSIKTLVDALGGRLKIFTLHFPPLPSAINDDNPHVNRVICIGRRKYIRECSRE